MPFKITPKSKIFRYKYAKIQASLGAQLVKNPPAMRRLQFNSQVGKIPWRRDKLPTPVFLGFLCDSAGKESACDVEDLGSIIHYKYNVRNTYNLNFSSRHSEKVKRYKKLNNFLIKEYIQNIIFQYNGLCCDAEVYQFQTYITKLCINTILLILNSEY